jgi:uncharacterized repeat protein (TIGR03847 family)
MPNTHDFGPLVHISAEAIGKPGQRRFRLRALNSASECAILWLEKEQLAALGEAIESVLGAEEYVHQPLAPDDAEPEPVFPLRATVEIQLAQLSMGVNSESRRIVLIAADGPQGEDETRGVTMEFDYHKGHELRTQITGVVAAGRPPCPLCTAPMDPAGHVCVKKNGHQPH